MTPAAGGLARSLAIAANPVIAEPFCWASTTDPQTMAPDTVNSAAVLGFLNNFHERLVRRGKDMSIEPALATGWEPIGDGAGWRFFLRQGVSFHDGSEFDAADVLFSYQRASSEQADTRSLFSPVSEVVVVDDHTVDFLTTAPDPIFPDSIANWMLMDSGWAVAIAAGRPAKDAENHATLNANGTGAFRLSERQPGLQTVLEPFDAWLGTPEHNITRATFIPIQNPSTAVAALLSGDVDLIEPVPVQGAARLSQSPGVTLVQGIEARVIMLGFDHTGATLNYGTGQGAENPFRAPRVRRAVAQSVNVPAIRQTIMRGAAEPALQLLPAGTRGYAEQLGDRPACDSEAAKALLAEAGYPDGFGFGLKCTNDRYHNDEALRQAIVGLLAQVGLDVRLDSMLVRNYRTGLREDWFDMYLLGWSPGTFDAEHPIRLLALSPTDRPGTWNFGGYSNARVDELLPLIQSEIDEDSRQAMLDEVAGNLQDEIAYMTLYVQPLLWGTAESVALTQQPDNFLILRWVAVN